MTFVVSTSTPLFSTSWAPKTLAQYVGTCIFLIALSILFRFLLAWRHVLSHSWAKKSGSSRIVVATSPPVGDEKTDSVESGGPVVLRQDGWGGRPWRFSTDLPRAGMTVLVSGVGYLMMLAVMTMNVGYFMSVLAGIFVGELVWGRFIEGAEH
ncbi:hypothetical protein K440DRAFT_541437 [Wilcoxina mikolae CBS 423.85]|nr:hypothetical protein K440DRAFT_541437 [Wilcoxina mikolae CBS 423.85]